ncbi:MAG TPA: DUF5668 domain-containing protein [Sphingobacteriaceae bacterium]
MKNLSTNGSAAGKVMTGAILIVVGGILLLDNLGTHLPDWVLSWPMLLIAIGLISGVKHQFKKPGAFVLLFIGFVFLTDRYFLPINFSIVWPAMLIGAGLWMIFRNNHSPKCRNYTHDHI